MAGDTIVLFEFEKGAEAIVVSSERHYRLVSPEEMSDEDLENYRERML